LLKAFIDILLCQNDQSNKISWLSKTLDHGSNWVLDAIFRIYN